MSPLGNYRGLGRGLFPLKKEFPDHPQGPYHDNDADEGDEEADREASHQWDHEEDHDQGPKDHQYRSHYYWNYRCVMV